MRLRVLPALLLLVVAAASAGCDFSDPGEETIVLTPDFVLGDLTGGTFQLSQEQGNVVMLHFFAPWCPVCQAEAPDINALYELYKTRDVTIVGIAIRAESLEQIETYAVDFEVPYPVLVDAPQPVGLTVAEAYGVVSIPTTFFVSKTGELAGRFAGALSLEDFSNILDTLLEEEEE